MLTGLRRFQSTADRGLETTTYSTGMPTFPGHARTSPGPRRTPTRSTRHGPAVVLVAHGSRDPRAAEATRALARAVGAARPDWRVRVSYLDHSLPRPVQVLAGLEAAGHLRAIMVPLLLTAAYHGRVDVPAEVAAARAAGLRLEVDVTDVLGPRCGQVDPLLTAALLRRLSEAGPGAATPGAAIPGAAIPGAGGRGAGGPGAAGVDACGFGAAGFDALVLAAAGTRDGAARGTVGRVAAALGARLGVPCRVAYASAAPPAAGVAVARLRAAGARRVGVAAYFLAPGLLHDATVHAACAAGAAGVALPLGPAPELVGLVLSRVDAVARAPLAVYAA
jgi:sirohydrochlorin ferrochelatase